MRVVLILLFLSLAVACSKSRTVYNPDEAFSNSEFFEDNEKLNETIKPVPTLTVAEACFYNQSLQSMDQNGNGFRLPSNTLFCKWSEQGEVQLLSIRFLSEKSECPSGDGLSRLSETGRENLSLVLKACRNANWYRPDDGAPPHANYQRRCFRSVEFIEELRVMPLAAVMQKSFAIPIKYYAWKGDKVLVYIPKGATDKAYIANQLNFALQQLNLEEVSCDS